jgi:hypothetical protein
MQTGQLSNKTLVKILHTQKPVYICKFLHLRKLQFFFIWWLHSAVHPNKFLCLKIACARNFNAIVTKLSNVPPLAFCKATVFLHILWDGYLGLIFHEGCRFFSFLLYPVTPPSFPVGTVWLLSQGHCYWGNIPDPAPQLRTCTKNM